MKRLLLIDLDGTIRKPISGAKFIQHSQDDEPGTVWGAFFKKQMPLPKFGSFKTTATRQMNGMSKSSG